jgi:7-cyano-7-deazaguanine synthase
MSLQENTIFLSFALGFAETLPSFDIFFGMNQLDSMNYPDCRLEYIRAFEQLANLATASATQGQKRLRIHTPLSQMNKAQVIRTGLDLGIDYSITTSCYDPAPDGAACGQCDACHLRRKGFEANGVVDPIRYL